MIILAWRHIRSSFSVHDFSSQKKKMRVSTLLRMSQWEIPKGPATPLWVHYKRFPLGTSENYKGSFIKSLIGDAPSLFVSIIGWSFCTGCLFWAWYTHTKYERFMNTPYKRDLIVIRPDDRLMDVIINRPAYYSDRMRERPERRVFEPIKIPQSKEFMYSK